jgi:hypothetical protein
MVLPRSVVEESGKYQPLVEFGQQPLVVFLGFSLGH